MIDGLPPTDSLLRPCIEAKDVTRLQGAVDRGTSVFGIVDAFLNLGPGTPVPAGTSRKDLSEALKVLTDLLKRGVVGYEVRKINGRPHKVFVDVAMGSDLARAPLYRGSSVDRLV